MKAGVILIQARYLVWNVYSQSLPIRLSRTNSLFMSISLSVSLLHFLSRPLSPSVILSFSLFLSCSLFLSPSHSLSLSLSVGVHRNSAGWGRFWRSSSPEHQLLPAETLRQDPAVQGPAQGWASQHPHWRSRSKHKQIPPTTSTREHYAPVTTCGGTKMASVVSSSGAHPEQSQERSELLPAGGGLRHGVIPAPAVWEHPPRVPDRELPSHLGCPGRAHQTGTLRPPPPWSGCSTPTVRPWLCVLCVDPGAVHGVGRGPWDQDLIQGPPSPRVPLQELRPHLQAQEKHQHEHSDIRFQEHDEGTLILQPLLSRCRSFHIGLTTKTMPLDLMEEGYIGQFMNMNQICWYCSCLALWFKSKQEWSQYYDYCKSERER